MAKSASLPSTRTTSPPPSIPQLKLSPQNQSDLQHISDILHLLHHRNHNQHRRSIWYRHFSIFRKHSNILLDHLSVLAEQPTTHLGKHRKKATDAKVHARIQKELGFWRDVLVPKWQHAFAQVTADGRFAVLGVVLLAALAQVGRIVGLVGVYESMGEEEVRRVLERFAQEAWSEDEVEGGDEGVKIERVVDDDDDDDDDGGGQNEDFGEILRREELSDEKDEMAVEDAKVVERDVRKGESSKCMALEQDVLEQSRRTLVRASVSPLVEEDESPVASPVLAPVKKKVKSADVSASLKSKTEKRAAKDKLLASSKPPKKKKKKNAIDDLFNGL